MNTPVWSELAKAYDENCKVLEKAREAYSHDVTAILTSIADDLVRGSSLDEELKAATPDPSREVDEDLYFPLRKTIKYNISGPDGASIAAALVRFSAPWEQGNGTLQFGLLPRNSDWTMTLHCRVLADEWVERNPSEDGVSGWIYSKSLSLSARDPIPSASKLLQDILRLGYRVVADVRRMEELLAECKRRLDADPNLAQDLPGERPSDVTPWDRSTYRYVQLNRSAPSYFGFWVGYDADKSLLMLGYNGVTERETKLEAALEDAVGARDWMMYDRTNFGGTIRSASQLETASDEDIVETMRKAFKIFVQVVTAAASVHSA